METRHCASCKGAKTVFHPGFTTAEGKVYHDTTRNCVFCDGSGAFAAIDEAAIRAAIKGRKGLRSKRPANRRAYYVWRMARFHGGADVCLPMGASLDVHGDPFKPELDALADKVAKEVFKTDLVAAHRWGLALGYINNPLPGLPASAYPCGPVADKDKPEEEAHELT